MVCFYDVVAIATQAEFIPQLKQRAFFRMSCKGRWAKAQEKVKPCPEMTDFRCRKTNSIFRSF